MKNHFTIIAFAIFLSSCATVNYFGDKLPPTSTVDIYYSAHDVKKEYKVIGHLTYPNGDQEEVKAALIAHAKTVGADAIIILGTQAVKDSPAAFVNADAIKYETKP